MTMLQFKRETVVQVLGCTKQMCGIRKAYWVMVVKKLVRKNTNLGESHNSVIYT